MSSDVTVWIKVWIKDVSLYNIGTVVKCNIFFKPAKPTLVQTNWV